MKSKTTLAGLGLVAVTVGALGVGTAFASTHRSTTVKASHSTPAAETPTATDNDNVQQGDQSGPDNNAAETPTASDKPDSAADPAGTDVATPGDKADSATEKAAPETGSSETADNSDGPGGYADTNPNADTQQEGEH